MLILLYLPLENHTSNFRLRATLIAYQSDTQPRPESRADLIVEVIVVPIFVRILSIDSSTLENSSAPMHPLHFPLDNRIPLFSFSLFPRFIYFFAHLKSLVTERTNERTNMRNSLPVLRRASPVYFYFVKPLYFKSDFSSFFLPKYVRTVTFSCALHFCIYIFYVYI